MLALAFMPPSCYNCTLTHGIPEHSRRINERHEREPGDNHLCSLINRQGGHHGLVTTREGSISLAFVTP